MEENKYLIDNAVVDSTITQEIFLQGTEKTWICIMILNTGHEVTAHRYFVEDSPLNATEKKKIVRDMAFDKAFDVLQGLSTWQKRVAQMLSEEAQKKKDDKQ
jgi:hypothetical protein